MFHITYAPLVVQCTCAWGPVVPSCLCYTTLRYHETCRMVVWLRQRVQNWSRCARSSMKFVIKGLLYLLDHRSYMIWDTENEDIGIRLSSPPAFITRLLHGILSQTASLNHTNVWFNDHNLHFIPSKIQNRITQDDWNPRSCNTTRWEKSHDVNFNHSDKLWLNFEVCRFCAAFLRIFLQLLPVFQPQIILSSWISIVELSCASKSRARLLIHSANRFHYRGFCH